jgi:hypothetical protein
LTSRDREIINLQGGSLTPFLDMQRSQIDRTIAHHNTRWGHLKMITKDGLDMDKIFVNQAE